MIRSEPKLMPITHTNMYSYALLESCDLKLNSFLIDRVISLHPDCSHQGEGYTFLAALGVIPSDLHTFIYFLLCTVVTKEPLFSPGADLGGGGGGGGPGSADPPFPI